MDVPFGPVCMRNTNFLVMEASMQDEELIIGLPELKKIGLDPVRIIDEVRENFHTTDFFDCGPTAAFENPSRMGRMMLLRYAKCVKSDNKYDSYSDEEWRIPDSGQRCRREKDCDQMITLFSLARLLTLMGYKKNFFGRVNCDPGSGNFRDRYYASILCQYILC
jgi:hypothetical protein